MFFMKENFTSIRTFLILAVAIPLLATGCSRGPAPSSEQLVERFPSIGPDSTREQNEEILCPFLRMVERAGLLDDEESLTVSVNTVATAAEDLGCSRVECTAIAQVASNGQGISGVDLENLHEADGIAHECGFTFAEGGTAVSDEVRQATLDRLGELADEDGNLVFDDIMTVKQEICDSQGVEISGPGRTEAQLIFAYLGGVENGVIAHSDVVSFLNAEMPETKTSRWVDASLLNAVE